MSVPAPGDTLATSATHAIPHFVGGHAVQSTSGRFGDVYNPALGKSTYRVALANKAEANRAVEIASAAFPQSAALPPLRRARILNRFREVLVQNQTRLAAIITSEHGKVLSHTEGGDRRGLEVVEFATGIPHLLKSEYTEQVASVGESTHLVWLNPFQSLLQ